MTSEENTIISFLGSSPETFYARREIARRAVKRTLFEENPQWANAPIAALLLRGLLEQNKEGLLRLKKEAV